MDNKMSEDIERELNSLENVFNSAKVLAFIQMKELKDHAERLIRDGLDPSEVWMTLAAQYLCRYVTMLVREFRHVEIEEPDEFSSRLLLEIVSVKKPRKSKKRQVTKQEKSEEDEFSEAINELDRADLAVRDNVMKKLAEQRARIDSYVENGADGFDIWRSEALLYMCESAALELYIDGFDAQEANALSAVALYRMGHQDILYPQENEEGA